MLRQLSPRTTETKAPEHQQDDRSGGDADKDVQGEAVTKYSWPEGKNAVSIHLELDGLDDVTEDAFKAESGKTNVSLTIASVAGKQRIFTLTGLAHEITGVKVCPEEMKTDGFPEARERRKRKLGISCSVKPSTKEAVADEHRRTATQVSHLVSAKGH